MGVALLTPIFRPAAVATRSAVAARVGALAGLAVFYAVLASVLPPVDDELYYWCWAQNLQLSYYDHPPMVAYFIRLSTALFGDTVFALRLPALVASVVAFGVIASLCRWNRILLATVFTPLFTFGAVLVTPDTPLLLFWSLYLVWLTKLHTRFATEDRVSWGFWALGGVILGCGVLGKYTMALAVPAGAVSLVFVRPWSRWLPRYVGHGIVSFVVASPILFFNIREDFAPIRYQWEHATASGSSGLKTFGEFVGVQVVGFGLLPFALLPWVARNYRRLVTDPIRRVCVCLYAVPLAIFVFKSMRGPLEGNWAIVSYLGFWPIAAVWFETIRGNARSRWWTAAACAPPVVCVVGLAAHLVYPFPVVPARHDRITRQYDRIDALRRTAEAVRARDESVHVFTAAYQNVSALRFLGVDARQIDGLTRPSHFTRPPEHPRDFEHVLVFSDGPLPAEVTAGFSVPACVFQTPVVVRGECLATYMLWELRKLPPP